MRIVDQHVELLQKILAENALDLEAGRLQVLKVVHQDLLVGDGYESRSASESRFAKEADAWNPTLATSASP